jgi:hypothetical protein
MSRLVNFVLRIAMWAALGGVLGVTGVVVVQVFFQGGALDSAFDSAEVVYGGMIGLVAGAVFGFFRRH